MDYEDYNQDSNLTDETVSHRTFEGGDTANSSTTNMNQSFAQKLQEAREIRDCNEQSNMTPISAESPNSTLLPNDFSKPNINQPLDNHTEKYPISFSNFTVLIDIVRGLPDPLDTITLFTDDIPGIISILVDNYKFLEHATIKNRFTRLRKKLSAILNPSEADNGSENLDNESEAFEIESESIDSDCAST